MKSTVLTGMVPQIKPAVCGGGKMHIQGRKLKGVLNEFSDSRTITFKERETGDVVDVEYQMEENEKGYFQKKTALIQLPERVLR